MGLFTTKAKMQKEFNYDLVQKYEQIITLLVEIKKANMAEDINLGQGSYIKNFKRRQKNVDDLVSSSIEVLQDRKRELLNVHRHTKSSTNK